ncbi:MAG: STAS domain-containing protein [Gemmatimonadetes bacterium]|nr:STAS domain-containing protein [Gemmatimonadota bacterium]
MTIESYRFIRHADVLTVELGERLGMENRQELKSAVASALDTGARLVRVRFAAAERSTFVDSSGWGVLVALSRKAQEAGARLVLAEVDPGNLEYLALTRLDGFFRMEAGEERRAA